MRSAGGYGCAEAGLNWKETGGAVSWRGTADADDTSLEKENLLLAEVWGQVAEDNLHGGVGVHHTSASSMAIGTNVGMHRGSFVQADSLKVNRADLSFVTGSSCSIQLSGLRSTRTKRRWT